ncbi:hypothetical protein FDP41_000507 [Naegleria fowleri]|uniref:BTB domain-containing protein n=1 Tax=Naegleria fowleri TaxID=5763 RepID=A0A6A5CH40_NAEFO|nr:uncharacterized protein FDP41_000507 [Naegleria fowleri]KAF0984608.1 hypothetical protein FDP41_000507 [Naegleria fowleri]CAG4716380.1 unnamed protein product [Naegleria fowleri]
MSFSFASSNPSQQQQSSNNTTSGSTTFPPSFSSQPNTITPSTSFSFDSTTSNNGFGSNTTPSSFSLPSSETTATTGFNFSSSASNNRQEATTTTGFNFGASTTSQGASSFVPTSTNTTPFGFGPPQQPTFSAPSSNFGNTNSSFGFSFGTFSNNDFTFINNPLKTNDIPFNDPSHFSDLVIEIIVNNHGNGYSNLYNSIYAHRIIICAASEVLVRMIKPKGEKNVIEIVCSDTSEAFYAQTMIACLYKSCNIRLQDVFILYDLFEKYGINSCKDVINSNMRNQAERNQDAALECLKYVQRVPLTNISEPLLSLVYTSLNFFKRRISSDGFTYQMEEALRNLDYYFIERYVRMCCQSFQADVSILNLVNAWVKSNLEEHNKESYVIPIVEALTSQPKTGQIATQLISVLSCEASPYEFLSLISAERRLRIINKLCSFLVSTTTTSTPSFPSSTNVQAPVGFF